jgi:pimeloyl-ACP methyl ester carboxylesterase
MRHPRIAVLATLVLAAGCSPTASPPASMTPSEATSEEAPSTPPSNAPTSSPAAEASGPPSGPGHFAGSIDIGGRSLFLECEGEGGPTMILDAGLGGDSGNWSRVGFLPRLTPLGRWCVYDRANRGRSDADPRMRTSADIVEDLHALTVAAQLEPPYVLIGHSFGGYNVRLYASTYPDEVAGLVLMDTVTPEFVAGQETLLTPEQWVIEAESYRGNTEPYIDFLASGDEVAQADPLPSLLPILVVAATERHAGNVSWPADWPGAELDKLWDQEQRGLGALTSRGTLVIAADTAHRIHIQRPDYMAGLIADFLGVVRALR